MRSVFWILGTGFGLGLVRVVVGLVFGLGGSGASGGCSALRLCTCVAGTWTCNGTAAWCRYPREEEKGGDKVSVLSYKNTFICL